MDEEEVVFSIGLVISGLYYDFLILIQYLFLYRLNGYWLPKAKIS